MGVSRVSKSQSEILQKISLTDYLGRPPTQEELDRFLTEAIDFIVQRTQSGSDKNDKAFKPYTSEYAAEKGVGTSSVDLTLFGDMLLSIDGSVSGDSVEIKITGDEAAKAYGHITGFKGHPTIPNGKYKRDFFGLTDSQAEFIAEGVKDNSQGFVSEQDTREVNRENIGDILRQIGLLSE